MEWFVMICCCWYFLVSTVRSEKKTNKFPLSHSKKLRFMLLRFIPIVKVASSEAFQGDLGWLGSGCVAHFHCLGCFPDWQCEQEHRRRLVWCVWRWWGCSPVGGCSLLCRGVVLLLPPAWIRTKASDSSSAQHWNTTHAGQIWLCTNGDWTLRGDGSLCLRTAVHLIHVDVMFIHQLLYQVHTHVKAVHFKWSYIEFIWAAGGCDDLWCGLRCWCVET